MNCNKIPTEVAYNIRWKRDLLLPPDREYENARIAEIAKRQQELIREMNELDVELYKIYREENKNENFNS